MPELPEVETIRRALEKIVGGQRFKSVQIRRPDLRGPIPPGLSRAVAGRMCRGIIRRGKYMIFEMEGETGWALHLGMSGRVSLLEDVAAYSPLKHDHLIFTLENGAGFAFNDARRFGQVFLVDSKQWPASPPFSRMGPEPLAPGFDGAALRAALGGRKGPIKTALLDQAVVSGVGNIYASEALYEAGIDPARPAGSLSASEAGRLARAIRSVLTKAIAAGGSTLKDYRHADGSLGYFQHLFSVYDRAGAACPGCSCDVAKTGGIAKTLQAGRSTFSCAVKQK